MTASVEHSDRHLLCHYLGRDYRPALYGAEKQIRNCSSNLPLKNGMWHLSGGAWNMSVRKYSYLTAMKCIC
jgi:hypothetical protein